MILIYAALFVVLVVVVIIYYNVKAKYQEAHPKNCVKCNKLIPTGIKLVDGVMCEECGKFTYAGNEYQIDHLLCYKGTKHLTYTEVKQFYDSIPDRELMESTFSETRKSPLGDISVDDNQKLIKVKNSFLHKISDIKTIRLVYDYEAGGIHEHDTGHYTGGHLEIEYNDLYMKDIIDKHVDEKFFDFATKNAAKKLYEEEIEFLENLTGLKHQTTSF